LLEYKIAEIMMKTIVNATDYSENAVAALKYAYSLSKKMGANLKVVHVFDFPTVIDTAIMEPIPHLEKNTYKKHNSKLIDFCKEHLGDDLDTMNVCTEAVEDVSVVNGIISAAAELDATFIITGMKGVNVFKEFIMGNTTKHLIEKSSCPVLAIPAEATHKQLETIVYASDFLEEDISAIEELVEIARPFNAVIKVLHITTEEEYDGITQMEWFKEELKQKIKYKKIEFEVIFSEDVFDSIRIYLGDVNADLVAMMERKKYGLMDKFTHRDLVKRMGSYGMIPLMSFNKKTYELINF